MAGKATTRKSASTKPKKGVKKDGTNKAKAVSGQHRAGIVWGVGRTASALRKGRFSERFGKGAAIFMAAVLQYLTSEILEMAGDIASEKKNSIIRPAYIQTAIRNDEELVKLFALT